MYNTDIPRREELPSTARLIRSTIMALLVALLLLVTIVLPAEYAIDPTGVGGMLGLSEMGEIKQQLAEEAAADEALKMTAEVAVDEAMDASASPAPSAQPAEAAPAAQPAWQDEVTIVLAPGEGTEFKLLMSQGAVARFAWVAEGGPINFDTHGDGSGQSISYEKGRGVPQDEGELVAAFTGSHGWFFRNRNDTDITLTLRTEGDYEELKKVL